MSQAHVPFFTPRRGGPARVWARCLVVAALCGAAAAVFPGCSDKERVLSGSEAQEYKRTLVRDHPGELSAGQVEQLARYMGRTKADIDRVFDQLRAQHAAAAARDRKAWEESRKDPTILPKGNTKGGS